jgi:hypothetical protein
MVGWFCEELFGSFLGRFDEAFLRERSLCISFLMLSSSLLFLGFCLRWFCNQGQFLAFKLKKNMTSKAHQYTILLLN